MNLYLKHNAFVEINLFVNESNVNIPDFPKTTARYTSKYLLAANTLTISNSILNFPSSTRFLEHGHWINFLTMCLKLEIILVMLLVEFFK